MIDLQTFIDNSMKASRAASLASSDRLTLGEMIIKMEAIVEKQKQRVLEGNEEGRVSYDFEYLYPTRLDSWRGVYAELALNFEDSRSSGKQLSANEFLDLLKSAVGKEFQGYKGGEFVMSRQTPVWVANYGKSGNTAIIDIIDDGYSIIIMTAYRES